MQARVADTVWSKDVYPPSDDSFALVDAVATRLKTREVLPRTCLEVGSGSGYVCVSLGLMLKALGQQRYHIWATDINPQAAQCTAETAVAHGVDVDVVVTRFWDGLRHPAVTSELDLVLFNPPYVPTPRDEMYTSPIAASWAGGESGRHIIDAFLLRIKPLLRSHPAEVLMVTIEQNRPFEIIEELRREGFEADVVLMRQADQEKLFVLSVRHPHPSCQESVVVFHLPLDRDPNTIRP